MGKAIKVLQIVIFAFFLLAPLLFLNKDPEKVVFVENKRVAQFPSLLAEDGSMGRDFTVKFEDYWNDNIGFREVAIEWNAAFSYSVFGKLTIPNFQRGTDGHIFYTNAVGGPFIDSLENYQGSLILDEYELEGIRAQVESAQHYFEDCDIQFLLTLIPDKEQIYPEYYPPSILQTANHPVMDVISRDLHEKTSVDVLYLLEPLLTGKKTNEEVYYRNWDPTHWNMHGAFVGYQEIMQRCQTYYPALSIYSKDDFNIFEEAGRGTIGYLNRSQLLCNAMDLQDSIIHYEKIGGYTSVRQETSQEAQDIFNYVNPACPDAPRILIIGDSYIRTFIMDMMADSFSALHFERPSTSGRIKELTEEFKPDIVLYESVQRMLVPPNYFVGLDF